MDSTVVYDWVLNYSRKPRCPGCNNKLGVHTEKHKLKEFRCGKCGKFIAVLADQESYEKHSRDQ